MTPQPAQYASVWTYKDTCTWEHCPDHIQQQTELFTPTSTAPCQSPWGWYTKL